MWCKDPLSVFCIEFRDNIIVVGVGIKLTLDSEIIMGAYCLWLWDDEIVVSALFLWVDDTSYEQGAEKDDIDFIHV